MPASRRQLVAQGVAGGIDATYRRFADQVATAAPADLAPGDRVGQTARLLRLQTLLPGASATFMLGPKGRLRAASAPFLPQESSVADAPWFAQAMAAAPNTIAVQVLDQPWLAIDAGIVLTRTITDAAGSPVGLIGAVLPRTGLMELAHPAWLPTGLTAELRIGQDRTTLPAAANAAMPDPAPWPTRLMQAGLHWLGEPAAWTATVPLRSLDARVVATMQPDAALPAVALGRPLLASGAAVLLAWLLGALAIARRRAGVTPPALAGFGADWQCAMDEGGRMRSMHGLVPGVLAAQQGAPLQQALGLVPDSEATTQIATALRERTAALLDVDLAGRRYRVALAPVGTGRFICSGRDVSDEAAATAARDAAETAAAEARRTSIGCSPPSATTSARR